MLHQRTATASQAMEVQIFKVSPQFATLIVEHHEQIKLAAGIGRGMNSILSWSQLDHSVGTFEKRRAKQFRRICICSSAETPQLRRHADRIESMSPKCNIR
jgi:hypothetical protein